MNTTIEREKEILKEVCDNCTWIWINVYLEPRKIIDHVEGFVIVAAVFMIVLVIGAPRRRQSQNNILKYGVEGAFVLSFPLLSYTIGLIQGQVIKNVLYPVWAMFLCMLFGGSNSMSSRKLDENKQLLKLYCNQILFGCYIGASLSAFSAVGKTRACVIVVMATICLLAYKSFEQLFTAILASKPTSDNGVKRLAIYMKLEHQRSLSWDPRTMQGYKYVVLIHEDRHSEKLGIGESAITLEKIWCGDMGVLSSSDSRICRLKDLCLSFALFHLVVRRYFGYTCHESKLDKTRDLVLHGLLETEQDYERAFQVIEAELAFVCDFFFTKYAFIMYNREVLSCGFSLASAFLIIAVGEWAISVLNTSVSMDYYSLIKMSARDITFTRIVLGVFSVLQLMEIWSYCVSDWAKVSLVCKYVRNPSWWGNTRIKKLLLFLGRPHGHYWRNTIGQYSVLDFFRSGFWDRLRDYFYQSRRKGKSVELSMEVKNAVAWTIKTSINCHLSNGASALRRHGISDELCWASQISDEFTLTHIILVWHVATSYCEISEMVTSPDEIYVHPNRGVATSLSKYVAYLVAFAPMLLPGSPIESECTLGELEKEAKETLKDLVSPRDKYEKLRELQNVVDAIPSSVADATAVEVPSAQLLAKGVMLGKALERMENPTIRWHLLADFWAEMLVYIAPSDNVAGHIELLPQGGEFVTHVWALLMHAGILERPAAAATAVP